MSASVIRTGTIDPNFTALKRIPDHLPPAKIGRDLPPPSLWIFPVYVNYFADFDRFSVKLPLELHQAIAPRVHYFLMQLSAACKQGFSSGENAWSNS